MSQTTIFYFILNDTELQNRALLVIFETVDFKKNVSNLYEEEGVTLKA